VVEQVTLLQLVLLKEMMGEQQDQQVVHTQAVVEVEQVEQDQTLQEHAEQQEQQVDQD